MVRYIESIGEENDCLMYVILDICNKLLSVKDKEEVWETYSRIFFIKQLPQNFLNENKCFFEAMACLFKVFSACIEIDKEIEIAFVQEEEKLSEANRKRRRELRGLNLSPEEMACISLYWQKSNLELAAAYLRDLMDKKNTPDTIQIPAQSCYARLSGMTNLWYASQSSTGYSHSMTLYA